MINAANRFSRWKQPVSLTMAMVISLFAGCHTLSYFRPAEPLPPQAMVAEPGEQQLIDRIHQNTRAVKNLHSYVKVRVDGLPSVSGTLVIEQPRRMRLQVGPLGMTDSGLDVGSNDELFWIWNRSSLGGQTPAIYFARHEDYANSQLQRSLQLHPQWIIDALGLIEFNSNVEGPYQRGDGRFEIRSTIETARGPMNRLTVIDPRYGWVLQQSVYDTENRLVAWANSTKYRYYPEQQASLPQHIELHVFDPQGQEMTLAVYVKSHEVNAPLYVNRDQIWRMPSPQDVPRIDLSKMGLNPAEPGGQSSHAPVPRQSARPWQRPKLRGFEML